MRKLLLGLIIAASVAVSLTVAPGPAAARWGYGWHGGGWGWNGGGYRAGLGWRGAALGYALTSPYYGYGYGYAPYSYGYYNYAPFYSYDEDVCVDCYQY